MYSTLQSTVQKAVIAATAIMVFFAHLLILEYSDQTLRDYCVLSCMNLTQHYALTGFQKL